MDNPTTPGRWSVEDLDPGDLAPDGRSPDELEHDCTGGHADGGVVLPDHTFGYDGLPMPGSARPEEAQVVERG